jgi:hypothetical protein
VDFVPAFLGCSGLPGLHRASFCLSALPARFSRLELLAFVSLLKLRLRRFCRPALFSIRPGPHPEHRFPLKDLVFLPAPARSAPIRGARDCSVFPFRKSRHAAGFSILFSSVISCQTDPGRLVFFGPSSRSVSAARFVGPVSVPAPRACVPVKLSVFLRVFDLEASIARARLFGLFRCHSAEAANASSQTPQIFFLWFYPYFFCHNSCR